MQAQVLHWNVSVSEAPAVWMLAAVYAVAIIASAIRRQASFKPLFASPPVNTRFLETWASGRALTNLLTRFGAQNCLMVAVTPHEFILQPHFPFTLAFMPELMDLEHTVRCANIRKAEEVLVGWMIVNPAIQIEFDTDLGPRTLQIFVRDRVRFLLAIHDMQN